MASTAELRTNLLDVLEAALAPADFRRVEQSFWKPSGQGGLGMHISFIKHAAEVDATIDVAVRHDAVEDRLNAVRADLSAREKRKTATVGVELGNRSEGRPRRYTVAGPVDVADAGARMLDAISRVGLPFLERFASLDEVGRVLEADRQEAKLICPIPARRQAAGSSPWVGSPSVQSASAVLPLAG
jgi:hypothetical protein